MSTLLYGSIHFRNGTQQVLDGFKGETIEELFEREIDDEKSFWIKTKSGKILKVILYESFDDDICISNRFEFYTSIAP